MTRPLLVTGVGRSGTTLVEKLLHSHPAICVASQPFPELFIRAKAGFLASRGLAPDNPVGTRFLDDEGTLAELDSFLSTDYWGSDRLDGIFDRMQSDTGQYMKSLVRARQSIVPGTFFDVYRQLLDAAAEQLAKSDCDLVGSKETWFEELAALLVRRGGAAVIVVRDPRDVLTSFRYGRGVEFGGPVRPTLFLLRQWRRSVAFALHLRGHPGFAIVRHEDVVARPEPTLADVTDRLGVEPLSAEAVRGPLIDQEGREWRGNSSFDQLTGLAPRSVGRWREQLDSSTVRYVNAVCGPELACFGYEGAWDPTIDHDVAIDEFEDPPFVGHPRFVANYSSSDEAIAAEKQRLRLLSSSVGVADATKWFIFDEAHELLGPTAPTQLFAPLESP